MINLTSAQQAIVKDDETVKNFRVHFPNGERADLGNSDIVYESVTFKESVCSDQSFRFGGADASCIEFETVGVGNIIGLTIECSMIFSLLGSTVTIPYGTFIVDSCPRDHASMVHRKVTAYSPNVNNGSLSEYEQRKLSRPRSDTAVYRPNLLYLLEETFGFLDGITHETTTKSTYGEQSRNTELSLRTVIDSDNIQHAYKLRVTADVRFISDTGYGNALYKLDFDHDPTCWEAYVSMMENSTDVYGHSFENYTDSIRYYFGINVNNADLTTLSDPHQLIYPFFSTSSDSVRIVEFYHITKIELLDVVSGIGEVHLGLLGPYDPCTNVSYTKYKITNTYVPVHLEFNHTLEVGSRYNFINAYSIADLVTGYAELSAGFFRRNRDNTFTLLHLDNSSPYALTASDVEGSAWWDEYVIKPIGRVTYTFKDENGDQVSEYVIDEYSQSVYDMSANYLLKNMALDVEDVSATSDMTDIQKYYTMSGNWYYYDGSAWTNAGAYTDITTIIDKLIETYFVPYIGTVDFVPLEATFRGMPFLQCGDAITLTAADGTVINSYILNQSFDGIQHISQDVETVQGIVIGSEIVY